MKNKLITLMILLPMLLFSQKDKQLHFAAGAAISSTIYTITYQTTKNKNKALIYAITASTLAGISKELYDKKTTGFDNKDLLYTVAGGVSLSLTINLFNKKYANRAIY